MAKLSSIELHILILTRLYPPDVGGASELFRILSGVWENECSVKRVLILTGRGQERGPWHEERGKTFVHRILPATRRGNRRADVLNRVRGLCTYAMLAVTAVWYSKQHEEWIVLVHGRYGRKFFLKILKLLGARVVVILSDHYRSPESLAHSDAVICITENVYERACAILVDKTKIYHVPLPLQLPRLPSSAILGAEVSRPYVLFAGEVSRWKGVDVLLEAFSEFRREQPSYHLLLAGPVCDAAFANGNYQGVSFLGEVNHEKVIALIKNADALILPSRSEGLPRVCLEAIALGTKVICPPGVPELQRACPEWVLPQIAVKEVLEKLRQVVQMPFRSSYDLRRHDPQIVGRRIINILETVLARSDRTGGSS